jgi:hypothetical protein
MALPQTHAVISTFLNLTQSLPDRIQRLRRWSYGSVASDLEKPDGFTVIEPGGF